MKAHIVIVAALPVEFGKVLDYGALACKWRWESATSERSIWGYRRTTSAKGLVMVLVQLPDPGPVSAGIVTADAIKDFSPDIVILTGIAAGYDIEMGDVIVADETIYIEPGKVTSDGLKHEFDIFTCDTWVVNGLLQVYAEFLASGRTFEKVIQDNLEMAVPEPLCRPTKVFKGGIFCTTKVIADSGYIAKFRDLFRKAIGLEMESAGVASAVRYAKEKVIRYVTVKSKCDGADRDKSDKWHAYAAATSAVLVVEYINGLCLSSTSINGHIGEPTITEMLVPRLSVLRPYEQDLVRRIVSDKISEINTVLARNYKSNLGIGANFLRRAAPLFANASRIYAISLDSVSRFWTDSSNILAAKEYLLQQKPGQHAKQVVRLFVFTDPDSAHRHAHVLDEHASTYDNVFICSHRSYTRIIQNLAPDGSLERFLSGDFAILHFHYDTFGGAETQRILAELGPDQLGYTDLQSEVSARHFAMLEDKFDSWKNHGTPGEWLASDPDVFWWQKGLWAKTEIWGICLKKMFSKRGADAIHVLAFTANGRSRKDMIEILADLKKSVTSNWPTGLREHIWIGQKIWNLTPRDYQCDGKISASPLIEGQFIMAMRFNTKNDLEEFYDSRSYSLFRRKMYERLDPSTAERFREIDELKEQIAARIEEGQAQSIDVNVEKQRVTDIYENIEKTMAQHVTYNDYLDDELIDQIVLTMPPMQ